MEQRTDEWCKERLGRFTASEIHKLMGVKGLGETGKTYPFEKAVEFVFGKVEDNFSSFDMQRGTELEPLAFKKFQEIKDLSFLEVETCGFFAIGKNAGASPDGLVSDNSILEIKCPKADTFFKVVAENKIDPKYFYQMQMQMMATGRNKAYYFVYYVFEGIEFWHEIILEKDEKVCSLITQRIEEAEVIKQDYIKKLENNKQF